MDLYTVKVIQDIEYGPGKWKGRQLGVFRVHEGREEQIGEYERNYGTLYNTFFPFHINGKDLALYSPFYTTTRIMELPSCKDLGGEEPDSYGFCPVDYFVPTYLDQECVQSTNNKAFPPTQTTRHRINNPTPDLLTPSSQTRRYTNEVTGQKCEDVLEYRPLTRIEYYSFGFVAGCVWADDNS